MASLSSSKLEARRKPNGIYQDLIQRFSDMGVASIANAEYGVHFFRKNWGDDFTTHFCYVDEDSKEFNGNVFGEILSEAHGTAVGARGNHFPRNNSQSVNQITDSTKARCNIVLGCPSNAPSRLKDLWHNQLCTLRSISDADRQQDPLDVENVHAKHIVQNNGATSDFDAIVLTGGLMYMVCDNENNGDNEREHAYQANINPKKRKITSLKGPDDESLERVVDRQHLLYPNGAMYDYRLMPDYGGRMFALSKAHLVQPNWRQLDGSLIKPWNNYLQLSAGTLIVVNISIRMHVLQPKSKKQTTRRVYQAIINFLKVVADSDIPVTCPSPPSISVSSTTISSGRSAAASVLHSIGTPAVSSKTASVGIPSVDENFSACDSRPYDEHIDESIHSIDNDEVLDCGSHFSDPEQMEFVGEEYVEHAIQDSGSSKRPRLFN
ncbi:hypothetical protein C8J55DRAFT_567020 [Lentinula edodes]|uniref:Uncharacterized protein n=1 Tax=Lentinula lateritia TaxID=40482 RepID=A0A9W8ZRL9_9AGAR|nr:hypothetical protein C8J55DRAFT_567020 [Lentinula edodes]